MLFFPFSLVNDAKQEDLLGTLLWLIDEDSSQFVTGVTVPVDGGFMAYSGV